MNERSESEFGTIESVAVVGAGAMGAMYAAHLARSGVGVRLVARGERARRLAATQLTVNGEPLTVPVWDADSAGVAEEPVGLVLVAVKHQQLAAALNDVAALVGPETIFLSVLNGLGSEAQIADRFGRPERVLPCIALAMDAEREGVEIRYRQAGKLVFGDPVALPAPSERVRAVQTVLDAAGLDWETPPDMRPQMWWKFMVNVGVNQASAVLNKPYGAFVPDGPARSLMLALMAEVIAVGRAEGVDMGRADLARWDQVLANQPAAGLTSMHQDVLAGRPTEVDIFAGEVVALGSRHSIATPYNQAIQWILHARMGA